MKIKQVPKAPIQIQRDKLLLQVEGLQRSLTEKNQTITLLQADLDSKTQVITQKDQTITTLQTEINLKNQTITEKEHIIDEIRTELFELQNDVVVIGEEALEGA
jgi:uncharacterized protein (DUF3084 family)